MSNSDKYTLQISWDSIWLSHERGGGIMVCFPGSQGSVPICSYRRNRPTSSKKDANDIAEFYLDIVLDST